MNKYLVIEKVIENRTMVTAFNKARADIAETLGAMGFDYLEIADNNAARAGLSNIRKLSHHFKVATMWDKLLFRVQSDDVVVIQYPVVHHTLLLGKVLKKHIARGIKIVGVVHDVDALRASQSREDSQYSARRREREDIAFLESCSILIVHNESMREVLRSNFSIHDNQMVNLGIFDYLIDENLSKQACVDQSYPIIVAGNLDKSKAGYIYRLPKGIVCNLYGPGFADQLNTGNLHYEGSFSYSELPAAIQGSFGLVWDGDSIQTCSGAYGDYLRINNPHKTSLYLALGLPVIIWDKAALAPLIEKHCAGISIASLEELPDVVNELPPEDYMKMKKGASNLGELLRCGKSIERAMTQILSVLGD